MCFPVQIESRKGQFTQGFIGFEEQGRVLPNAYKRKCFANISSPFLAKGLQNHK